MKRTIISAAIVAMMSTAALAQEVPPVGLEILPSEPTNQKMVFRFTGSRMAAAETSEQSVEPPVELASCSGFTFASTQEENDFLNYINAIGNSYSTVEDAIAGVTDGSANLNLDQTLTDGQAQSFPCDITGINFTRLSMSAFDGNDADFKADMGVSDISFLSGITHLGDISFSYVDGNSSGGLLDISALDSVESVSNTIYMSNADVSGNFSGLTYAGNINLSSMDGIPSFPSIESFSPSPGQGIFLNGMSGNINAFNNMTGDYGTLRNFYLMSGAGSGAVNLNVLNSLTSITDYININGNDFSSFNSFSSLESASYIQIDMNNFGSGSYTDMFNALTDGYAIGFGDNSFAGGTLSGFNGGVALRNYSYFNFRNNSGLSSLNVLDGFSGNPFSIRIDNNPQLNYINGFNAASPFYSTDLQVTILGNDLREINGFSNIHSLHRLEIRSSGLTSLNAFPDLGSVNEILLVNYPLSNFNIPLFGNLTGITDLKLFRDQGVPFAFTDVSGLQNLSNVRITIGESNNDTSVGNPTVSFTTFADPSSPLCQGIESDQVQVRHAGYIGSTANPSNPTYSYMSNYDAYPMFCGQSMPSGGGGMGESECYDMGGNPIPCPSGGF